ncbi:MAG: hypothetical protein KJ882_11325 [Proteobacteria bacterium]|nr:hypothetical protein [Pseudomonadota bacterium]
MPAGYRNTDGSYNNLSNNTNIWSSLESDANAWRRNLNYNHTDVNRNTNDKLYGFSVRCLKDWFSRRGIKFYAPADTIYEFQTTFMRFIPSVL